MSRSDAIRLFGGSFYEAQHRYTKLHKLILAERAWFLYNRTNGVRLALFLHRKI